MSSHWDDLSLTAVDESGTFAANLSDVWTLAVVPQGGIVAALALRAMQRTLGDSAQRPRSMTSVFAGQVSAGPVEIEVDVLRRGRSMSQLRATVRNPGVEAGLTAVAVFGAERRGFDFVDIHPPVVPDPDTLRSFRDPVPDGVDFSFGREPMPFWESIVETRPALGRAPWEPFVEGPSDVALWHRFDEPLVDADGHLDAAAILVVADTMPSSVAQKVDTSRDQWFGPSADFTVHFLHQPEPGWLLAQLRARVGVDGYASVEVTFWDERLTVPVAYATQMMFFAFGR